jgi:hypothetical protein
MTEMTSYKAAKLVNIELKKFEIKEIPPQMIYNYVGKGYIKSVDRNGQKLVTEVAIRNWVTHYINKKLSKLEEASELNVEVVEEVK